VAAWTVLLPGHHGVDHPGSHGIWVKVDNSRSPVWRSYEVSGAVVGTLGWPTRELSLCAFQGRCRLLPLKPGFVADEVIVDMEKLCSSATRME